MSKNLNISVLVAARDEYIDQLKCILVPLLIQGFNSIYQDAINLSKNKHIIYKFQELLKQIPQWNQTILQEESKRIKKKCPYIMDIVTAIFVTNVKVLASVRLKGSKEDIRVKIPTSDIFIHSIYIESAQQIFYDPFLFYHKGNQFGKVQENKYHVKQIISNSVDETIRQMLPFDDILQKYLADALNDNAEFGNGSESEEESVSDSDEESVDGGDFPSDEESEPGDDAEPPIKSFNLGENGNSPSQPFMFNKETDSDEEEEEAEFQPPPGHFTQPIEPEHQFINPPVQAPQAPLPVYQASQPPQPPQPPQGPPIQQPPVYQQVQQPNEQERFSFFS